MKKIISGIGCLLFIFLSSVNGQEIKDVIQSVKDGKVSISYTLSGKFYHTFNVFLYVSRDGGATYEGPLKEVAGDIGKGISRGKKNIIWDAMTEMPFSNETFSFDVRAEISNEKQKKSFFLMYVGNTVSYFGLRTGMLGKVGFYIEGRGNMVALNTGKYKYADGVVNFSQEGYYTFNGSNGYSALSALVGITYQPAKNFVFYLGAGYGKEEYLMQIDEINYDGDVKTGNSYVIYESYSNTGVEADLGIMIRIKKLIISAGATTINLKTYGWTAGIGISF